MRTLLPALAGLCACAGAALAEAGNCMDAAALLHVDAGLPRAAAVIAGRHELKVAVTGSASGSEGSSSAWRRSTTASSTIGSGTATRS